MEGLRDPRAELAELEPYASKEIVADVMLASNENPVDLAADVMERVTDRIRSCGLNRYPDPMAHELRELIAQANGLEPGNVIVGNGGDELIFNLMLAWGGPGRRLLDCPPTFVMYGIDATLTGTERVVVPRTDTFDIDADAVLARLEAGGIDMVAIAHPNNPTGNLEPETFLIDVLGATDALVLVDEAYYEFSRHTMRPHMSRHPNLVILRTFSKAFCLAGLRVGYVLAHEDVVLELTKVRQPYSVDSFSQMVAGVVFRERASFDSGVQEIIRERERVSAELDRLGGITVFPSEANFVLFRMSQAGAVWRDLLKHSSVLVRDFSRTPGLEGCLRVSVGTREENDRFLAAMAEIAERHVQAAEYLASGGAPAATDG